MPKATKKPVTIDFFEYKGSVNDLIYWVHSNPEIFDDHFTLSIENKLFVNTLEGTSYEVIADRDVIIRGVKGEYYPIRKDIFFETYDT